MDRNCENRSRGSLRKILMELILGLESAVFFVGVSLHEQ